MSIASIRFATHTRTWRLIAALTALLIGIGALLGGVFLYLFAGLAVAMNAIGFWFSDAGSRTALLAAAECGYRMRAPTDERGSGGG